MPVCFLRIDKRGVDLDGRGGRKFKRGQSETTKLDLSMGRKKSFLGLRLLRLSLRDGGWEQGEKQNG